MGEVRWNFVLAGAFTAAGVLGARAASADALEDLSARVSKLEAENAELRAEIQQMKAPTPPPANAGASSNAPSTPTPAPSRWTGAYAGLRTGFVAARTRSGSDTDLGGPTDQSFSGALGGVDAGADIQAGRVVVGLEGSVEYDGAHRNQTALGAGNPSLAGSCLVGTPASLAFFTMNRFLTCRASTGLEEEFTGRIGYAFADDRLLAFLRGGITRSHLAVSYIHVADTGLGDGSVATYVSGGSKSLTGDEFGLGLAYRPPGPWSYSAEFDARFYGDRAIHQGIYASEPPSFGRSGFLVTGANVHDLDDKVIRVTADYHLPN